MDETPLSPEARKALDEFGAQTAAPPPHAKTEAIWQSIEATRRPWLRWALAVAVAAAVIVTIWPRTPPPLLEVEASAAAQWKQEGDAVTLDRGRLTVRPRGDRAITVVTPQNSVLVQKAAAWFDVTPQGTEVHVESGEVEWRSGSRHGRVKTGEQVTIGPEPEEPAVAPVPRGPSAFTAETVLYEEAMRAHEKGVRADALRLFRAHREQFPAGIFAPEVSIGLMLDLLGEGKPRDAAEEARHFRTQFPLDPRVPSIRRWSEQLR